MNKKNTLIIILICFLGLFAKSQTITLTTSPSGSYCTGSSFVVPFTVSGNVWYSDNKFTVQLSNPSGSFNTGSTSIGTIAGQGSGSIVATLPKSATAGTGYKIRIISTNSVQTSNQSSAFTLNGVPNAPIVTSPVNYMQCASASALSATASSGNTLLWLDPITNSIGGTDFYTNGTNLEGVANPGQNRITVFSTLRSNVTITSVDYTIPAYQTVTGLSLGLFNSSGTLIATSNTTSLYNNTASPVKITSIFNFLITDQGSYSIGAVEGSGQVGAENSPTFPIDETTNSIRITGTTNGAKLFNNIIFSTGIASSTPPIPATTTVGTKIYYVKQQNANGCISEVAPITVNVSALAKPTVTTPVTYTQYYASPSALVATAAAGADLYWSSTVNGTYTTTLIVPSTSVIGSKTYFVKQMLGSCLSDAESIVVTITQMPAPTVVTPINYCLNAGAVPLTATPTVSGATLKWSGAITAAIGNTSTSDNVYADGPYSIRSTTFTALKQNIEIVSVDIAVPLYNSASGQVGLFDNSGVLLASKTFTGSGITVTIIFNYTLPTTGDFTLKLISGSGNFQNYSGNLPMSEGTNTLIIKSNVNSRIYGNIQFKTGADLASAPTPLTNVAGTTSYYVSQSFNGSESTPAKIDVIVSNGTPPTVTSTSPASRCGAGSVTISATISAGTANWYANSTGGSSVFTGLSFITPSIANTTTYYVDASNGCSSARTAVLATIDNVSMWTGSKGTDWSNALNWNSCGVPITGAPVIIPDVTNKPVLGGAINVIGDLTLQGNSKIFLNGKSLTIARQLGTGFISSTPSSSLTVTGTTNLNFDQTTVGSTNSLKNLTINAPSLISTLTNELNVFEQVNIVSGTLASGNGLLILKSSEILTSYVAPLTDANNANITGDVKVERFMKGGSNSLRGYRLMSSPVSQIPTKYNVQNLKQTMYISGAGGSGTDANSTTFDASPNNSPTIYHYNEKNKGSASASDYLAITSVTTDYFNRGEGMYVFNRGARLPTVGGIPRFTTTIIPEDNTIVFKGFLNVGDIDVNLSYTPTIPANNADGFNLVGNPYASTIDLNSGNITATDAVTTNTFYVLDPNTKQFAVYIRTGGNSTGLNTGKASQYIASSQGFFVKATGTNQKVTFKETAKTTQQLSTTLTPRLLMGTDNSPKPTVPQYIRLVMVNQIDTNAKDDIVLSFDANANSAFNAMEDAFDYGGNGTTFLSSLSSDQIKLAINSMPIIKENTRISIIANSTVSGNFNFEVGNLSSIDKRWNVFIVDHYKVDSVKVNIVPNYSFAVDRSIPDTYASNRFEIAFREKESLIANILSFDGAILSQDVNLSWKPSLLTPYDVVFTLQKSSDNIIFTDIYNVQSDSRSIYYYKDVQPGLGIFYYRLKQEAVNNQTSFTKSIPFTIANSLTNTNGFVMYPNPVKSSYTISLSIESVSEVKVRILDIFGKVVHRYIAKGKSWNMDASRLSAGTYIVELVDQKTNKLIGRSKFLKK